MSDYLWDKTGEPDAETERLENLLGQLRFQPTPFDLPAELPARPTAAPRATRTVISWPRLAVAASLTLAVLVGAWLMLKQQAGTTNDGRQIAGQSNGTGAGENHPSAVAPKAAGAVNENNAGGEKKGKEIPSAVPAQVEPRREERGAVPQRPRRPDLGSYSPSRLPRAGAARVNRIESANAPKRRDDAATPRVAPALREETAQLAAEREAAEKVMYALRVTSEKLSYARRQVQDATRGEENR